MTLALNGGKPAIRGDLRAFSSIGEEEIAAAVATIRSGPLSGFLGGELRGGLRVETLEQEFCNIFGSRYAVASNSATSGLLIASMACGVGPKTEVICSPLTMSASAAAPAFLGAGIKFGDVDPDTFNLMHWPVILPALQAVIVTNLFGHPASLKNMRALAEYHKLYLIEDNAQSIFAMEGTKYAGTVGHIGVYSLNVHKALNAGEGGICVTDDADLALHMRLFRNHSELAGFPVGLNLRMTEVTAAIALAQLAKREQIMAGRIRLAEDLTHLAVQYPGLIPPTVREGYKHSYYCWALKVERDRDWLVRAMQAEGLPLRKGYVDPLYRLKAFEKYKTPCPVAEKLHDETLCLFEVCAFNPSRNQMKGIKEAFEKVGEAYSRRNKEQKTEESVV